MKIKIKTHYKRAVNQKYNGILSHLKLMSIEKCIIRFVKDKISNKCCFHLPKSWLMVKEKLIANL